MKFEEANAIIKARYGYRVSFEKRQNGILYNDYFPDKDEPGIIDLEEAWDWAKRFACSVNSSQIVNVHVVHASNFIPVIGYESRELNSYPKQSTTP